MKVRRDGTGTYVVSLERGDRVRGCVEELAAREGIGGARVVAIGAVEDPELGCYALETRSYHRQSFPGVWELLSFDGSLSTWQGKPLLHAHACISGHDYSVRGGHFFDAGVGLMVEMLIEPLHEPIVRRFNEEVGLPRWEPGESDPGA